MGGKSGGGARTPVIEKNTLHGANKSKHIDLISSGEIFGFEHGNDEPLKSIYLNGTPIQNKDGTLNFSGVRAEFNRGTEDQDYLPSFNSVDRNIEVGAQVKKDIPVTRTVTDSEVTSIRVTAGVDALMSTTKEGDQRGTSVSMTIMVMKNNQIYTSKLMTIEGKGSRPFRQDATFDDLPEAPFEIRCVRNTADSNDDMLRNNTYFFNYVESIDSKMRYPMTAIAGLEIDAEQFGNNTPSRTYGIKGAIVQVPSNYDPENRTYSGLWDRLFKPAFTNNPAWVLYDALTNETDGLGLRLQGFRIDIDKFYELSKYCDELVDDGAGGKEPRFVCNAALQGDDAYNVINSICSSFRGVCGYDGDLVTIYYDRAHDVTSIYTNSNVVDGLFDYSQVERDKQYNQIQIQYVDETNGYETTISEVSDESHIAKTGAINTLSKVGFGRTKKSYAERDALWDLVTSLTETEIVSFSVGDQGIKHEIYDIIEIADNDYVGTTIGARIKSIDGAVITLDRPIEDALKFSIETQGGQQIFTVKRQISSNQYELTITPILVENAPCTAILSSVEARLFRCIQIDENDDGTYSITAIQHNPQKEAIVDKGAEYIPPNTTVINPAPGISNGVVSNDGRAIILEWDSLAVVGTNNTYRIQLFKDRELYRNYETKETSLRLEKLPQGEYVAEIYAVNERGQHSGKLTIAFSTSYKIDGLRAKGIIFGIQLSWHLPALITSDAFTEIWYSTENDIQTATKYAVVAYPQNSREITGLSIGDEFYFWFRLVDAEGNQGEFSYSILGKPSDNADDILGYLDGKISDKEISKDLQDQFDRNIDDKIGDIKLEIDSELDGIGIDLIGINSELDNIKTDITGIDSEIDGIKNDIISIDSEIESVKSDTEKALQDAEQNAKDILEKSEIIDSVSKKQGQAEANWLLAQMANVSAQKSQFSRSDVLTAQVANNISKIENVESVIVTDREATAFRFGQLNSRVGDAESKITNVEETLSNEIKAEASKREALEAVFDLSKASQQLQLMTQSSTDKSLSSRLFSMSASTANAHAKYDELQEVVATNEDARVTSEQKLQAEINSSKAEIGRIDQVMTSEFASQATSISNLSSELDGAKADIKQAEQTIVDNEKAQAQKNDEFNAQFDENKAKQQLSILTESTSTHSLSQRYFLLSAQTANSSAKLESLEKAFADSETAWAVTESRLQAEIDASKSQISRIDKVIVDNEKAQSITNESLKSEIDNTQASIKSIEKTQADDKKALTEQINSSSSEWKSAREVKYLAGDGVQKSPKEYLDEYGLTTVTEFGMGTWFSLGNRRFHTVETRVSYASGLGDGRVTQSAVENTESGEVIAKERKSISDDEWGLWSQIESIKGAQEKADKAKNEAIETSSASIKELARTQADDREAFTEQLSSASSEWKSAREIKYLSGEEKSKTPQEYLEAYGRTTVTEFGTRGFFDISIGGYFTVVTLIAYSSGLDRGRISQTATSNDFTKNVIMERKSTSETEWSDWITLEDIAGAKAKADAAQAEAIRISKASIDSLARTQADDKKALTEQIESAKSEIDGNSASITEIKSTQVEIDGKINSMWTLKVDANGAIGGIMLGSDGKESLFKVAADTFVISSGDQSVNMFTMQQINGKYVAAINGDLIAKGSISGDRITANTLITSPIIKGGRVESGHFAGGSINIGNGNFNVDSNGNLYAKSGKFEGTVYADKIEGDIVSYITIKQFTSTIGASYRFIIEAEPFDRVIRFSPFSAASWLRMSDSRSNAADPTLTVKMNGVQIYRITDRYTLFLEEKDSGYLTTSGYRSSKWLVLRNSEIQLQANGFADRVGVSTTEFAANIPKNQRAEFELTFQKTSTSPTNESYVVSEIPATIYRKSRVQVIYPTG